MKIKKILMMFSIIVLMGITTKLSAATLNCSVSCSDLTPLTGSTVTCKISATFTGADLQGIQGSISLVGATYKSISALNSFQSEGNSSKIILRRSAAVTGSTDLANVVLTMPSTAGTTTSLQITSCKASDSEGNTYGNVSSNKVNFTVEAPHVNSTINTLDSLSITGVTMSPTFNSSTTSYTASVDASSAVIVAAKTDSASSYVSGYGPRTVKLNYGKNTVLVKVKSESGSTKTYTIVITRIDNRETINTLASLSLSAGTLSPGFNSSTTSYTASVSSSIKTVTISSTLNGQSSSYVSGYGPRSVSLNYGVNKVLVKAKSESGSEKTYTINITREDDRDTNNYLSEIILSNGTLVFSKTTEKYTVNVLNEIESITIDATTDSDTSKVTGTGTKKLKVGENVVKLVVTAENKKTKTYTLTIVRAKEGVSELSSNNNVTGISITNHSINFDTNVKTYAVTLGEEEKSLDISVTTEDTNAFVTVSGNQNLQNGSVVLIRITAQNGEVNEYKVNITKDVAQSTDSGKMVKTIIAIVSILIIIAGVIFIAIKNSKSNSFKSPTFKK